MNANADDDTLERLREIVKKYTDAPEVRVDSRLKSELGLDSFDLVNFALDVRSAFGFALSGKALPGFATMGDIVEHVRQARREHE